jgi:hypothetical protein
MVRNFVACAVLAAAGTLFAVPDQALAGPRGGAMPAFRPAMMPHVAARPQFFFRGQHRAFAPGAGGRHRPASPRAYGTIRPSTPYGTIKPATPYGTVAASRPYGTVGNPEPRFGRITLAHPRSHLTRRHHRAYHLGWSYPLTVGGDVEYIGVPYDPAEAIPVYGPETDDPAPVRAQPAARRLSAAQDNGDACPAERVTVPAAEGEREITVVRCWRRSSSE